MAFIQGMDSPSPGNNHGLGVQRMETPADREAALAVLATTYRDEKRWVASVEHVVPPSEIGSRSVTWFVARVKGQPAGVLRVLYELPLDLYKKYDLKGLAAGVDVEAFLSAHRVAEVGRFAVPAPFRRHYLIAATLIRAAVRELVERGVSHCVTDSFEAEKTSPLRFISRFLGFRAVATHDKGELNCANRRVTSLVDIAATYRAMRKGGVKRWLFRFITKDWPAELHERLQAG
jgi:hypothetical protein